MGESMDDITRFYIARDKELNMIIKDRQNELIEISNLEDANYMLNKLQDEQQVKEALKDDTIKPLDDMLVVVAKLSLMYN